MGLWHRTLGLGPTAKRNDFDGQRAHFVTGYLQALCYETMIVTSNHPGYAMVELMVLQYLADVSYFIRYALGHTLCYAAGAHVEVYDIIVYAFTICILYKGAMEAASCMS